MTVPSPGPSVPAPDVSALDILRYAAGALRGHRLRTSLSVLGVAIGVASVIMLTSLGEGARLYVMGEFAQLGNTMLIVLPGKSETSGGLPIFARAPNDLTIEDVEMIRDRVPGVRLVAPLAVATLMARGNDRQRECMIIGTTAEFTEIRRYELSSGQRLPAGDLGHDVRVCLIGATVRKELFGEKNPLGEVLHVGGTRYRIRGVLAPAGVGMGGNIDEMVIVPVGGLLRTLNRTGLFRAFVDVRSPEDIPAVQRRITALIKERHNGVEDITIFTQEAMLETFNRILSVLTYALGGIAAISLGVAGVGIMNVMLVSVSERTREVGLLKALGATRGQITSAFLAESAVLSSAGGAVGLGIGLAAAATLQALYPAFPAQPPAWAVWAALIVSVAVGILFGMLPARRAARLDPVTALARR